MVKDQSAFPATNYLDPPVGSNHFGLDGFKTIAYEMFDALGPDLVDAVLVPTSRGDLIWGLFEGFRQLKPADLPTALPRLFAVAPFARKFGRASCRERVLQYVYIQLVPVDLKK